MFISDGPKCLDLLGTLFYACLEIAFTKNKFIYKYVEMPPHFYSLVSGEQNWSWDEDSFWIHAFGSKRLLSFMAPIVPNRSQFDLKNKLLLFKGWQHIPAKYNYPIKWPILIMQQTKRSYTKGICSLDDSNHRKYFKCLLLGSIKMVASGWKVKKRLKKTSLWSLWAGIPSKRKLTSWKKKTHFVTSYRPNKFFSTING